MAVLHGCWSMRLAQLACTAYPASMRLVLTLILLACITPFATAQERDPRIDDYLQRCDDGDAFYCVYAAGLLQRADPQFWLSDHNVALRMRGCELGSDGSCWKFAAMHFPNPYAPIWEDEEVFLPIARSGCANGSTMACWQASTILMDEGPDAQAEAIATARQSCEGGFSDGCARLADVLGNNGLDPIPAATQACYGRRPGYVRKLPHCQAACEAGNGQACRAVAQIYEWGRDGAQPLRADPRRAARFYAQACELGEAGSCSRPER
jgi:hypothetical protein